MVTNRCVRGIPYVRSLRTFLLKSTFILSSRNLLVGLFDHIRVWVSDNYFRSCHHAHTLHRLPFLTRSIPTYLYQREDVIQYQIWFCDRVLYSIPGCSNYPLQSPRSCRSNNSRDVAPPCFQPVPRRLRDASNDPERQQICSGTPLCNVRVSYSRRQAGESDRDGVFANGLGLWFLWKRDGWSYL